MRNFELNKKGLLHFFYRTLRFGDIGHFILEAEKLAVQLLLGGR